MLSAEFGAPRVNVSPVNPPAKDMSLLQSTEMVHVFDATKSIATC